MKNLVVPVALAAGIYYLATKSRVSQAKVSGAGGFDTVLAKSGRKWLTRPMDVRGNGETRETVVEVWAPAGEFGAHSNLLVATYKQTGTDKHKRVVVSTGSSASPEMIKNAGVDFGIKKAA